MPKCNLFEIEEMEIPMTTINISNMERRIINYMKIPNQTVTLIDDDEQMIKIIEARIRNKSSINKDNLLSWE